MVKRKQITNSNKPKPPKSELGPIRKSWDQTFSAVTAIKEHFNIKD